MAAIRKRLVQIKFHAPMNVHEVKIAGDFTDWDKGAIFMTRSGKSGVWTASIKTTLGEHQYRYMLDGNWFTDPSTEHIANSFGSENSVLRVN
jgi:1,4-alpha-glucan branching enzyme